MTTTIDTVTRDQIRRLRTEAIEADDTAMAETCDLALGALSDQHDDPDPEACRDALAECVRVIRYAEVRTEEG